MRNIFSHLQTCRWLSQGGYTKHVLFSIVFPKENHIIAPVPSATSSRLVRAYEQLCIDLPRAPADNCAAEDDDETRECCEFASWVGVSFHGMEDRCPILGRTYSIFRQRRKDVPGRSKIVEALWKPFLVCLKVAEATKGNLHGQGDDFGTPKILRQPHLQTWCRSPKGFGFEI